MGSTIDQWVLPKDTGLTTKPRFHVKILYRAGARLVLRTIVFGKAQVSAITATELYYIWRGNSSSKSVTRNGGISTIFIHILQLYLSTIYFFLSVSFDILKQKLDEIFKNWSINFI